MPKCTLVVPYDKFHGSVRDIIGSSGQVIFSSGKSGNVSRRYVTPANPQTIAQVAVRNYMITAANLFAGLGQTEVDRWNTLATNAAFTETDILGNKYQPSGIDIFVRCNMNSLLSGNGEVTSCPVTWTAQGADPIPTAIAYDTSDDEYTLTTTNSGVGTSEWCVIKMGNRVFTAAQKPRKNEMRLCSTDATQAYGVASATTWVWSPGQLTPTNGQILGIQVINLGEDFIRSAKADPAIVKLACTVTA